MTGPNPVFTTLFSYDTWNRIQNLTYADGEVVSFNYDSGGNIKTIAGQKQAVAYPYLTFIGYDDLYQLTSATGAFAKPSQATQKFTLSMAYDGIHNITHKTQTAFLALSNGSTTPNVALSYDYPYAYAGGRPHAASQVGNHAFLYDLDGNQAGWNATDSYQNRRMTWDKDGRCNRGRNNSMQPTTSNTTATPTAWSRRAPAARRSTSTRGTWRRSGGTRSRYFTGTTRIATKLRSPTGEGYGPGAKNLKEVAQYFYHPDHLGSTGFATDATGEVWQHLEYFPFGETWVDEVSDDTRVPYRFTGQELDQETRLYYFGARYYDPRTSVWQSPDPALGMYLNQTKLVHNHPTLAMDWRSQLSGAGQGAIFNPRNLNGFGYAHQDPVKFIDGDGQLVFIPIVLGVIWVADKGFAAYEAYKDYKAVQSGEKTITEVAEERATEQAAGVALGAAGRWGVKGFKYLYRARKAEAEVARVTGKVEREAGKAERKAAEAERTLCSFDASTLVTTKNGLKRIDQVSVNELVLAKDEKTGEIGWKQVEDRYVNNYKERVLLTLEAADGTREQIISNRIHPFFVKNKGWKQADELKAGDDVATSKEGIWAIVAATKIVDTPLRAYNLHVDGYHTYFVGKTQAWVHNACPTDRYKDALDQRHLDAARRESKAKSLLENSTALPMIISRKSETHSKVCKTA